MLLGLRTAICFKVHDEPYSTQSDASLYASENIIPAEYNDEQKSKIKAKRRGSDSGKRLRQSLFALCFKRMHITDEVMKKISTD